MKKQDLTRYSTLYDFSSTILQFSAQTINGAPSILSYFPQSTIDKIEENLKILLYKDRKTPKR